MSRNLKDGAAFRQAMKVARLLLRAMTIGVTDGE
jgi:hypothetical protein